MTLDDTRLARMAKGLAHPVRVKIVRLLISRERCITGELVDELPVAQSTASQHLKILRESGLIRGEVDGPRVCYCIDDEALQDIRALLGDLRPARPAVASCCDD